MSSNLTDRFTDEIYHLSHQPFPESILHQAKRCLLDYLGVTFAGAVMLRDKSNSLLNFLGGTSSDAALIGFNRRTSIEHAALLNGLSAHVAELDDGVNSGIVHPGSPILSALLPMAEKEGVKGADLLTGIIIGYETAIRIADAIQPSHKRRGFHATGTCGTIGAAMGIAAMLGFSKAQMKDTLSAAAVSASGMLKVLEDNSDLKPYNVGRASRTGLLSALMARAGFRGPDDVLSGDIGLLAMMAEQTDLSHLTEWSESSLRIERVYVKPYAACRYCHPAIDAALRINHNHSVSAEEVKCVNVATYALAVRNHDHTDINTVSSAKMSIPYSVAVALACGKASIEEFTTELINDSTVVMLTNKVSVKADDQLTDVFPGKCCAIVTVSTHDGYRYTERVDFPKGEPENPLSDDELIDKFMSLGAYGRKTDEERQEVVWIVWNLEREMHELFRLL